MKFQRGKIPTVISFVLLVAACLFFRAGNEDYIAQKKGELLNSIQNEFNYEVNELVQFAEKEKRSLEKLKRQYEESELMFFEEFQSENNGYFISVYNDEGELVAWNKNFRKINGALPVTETPIKKAFRERDNLFEIISAVDTFIINGRKYYFKVSFVFKKHFSLHNRFEERGDFTEKIEAEKNVRIFSANEFCKTSLPLKLGDETIGCVEPLKKISGEASCFYLSFLSLVISFLFGVSEIIRKSDTRNKLLRMAALVVFYRIILFFVFNDFNTASWSVANPEYFSSDFGYGFFGSLLSLFFSASLALVVFYESLRAIFGAEKLKPGRARRAVIFFTVFAVPFILRAYGATLRSMIFDSNIKVFSENYSVPEFTVLFYYFNVLLVSAAFVFLLFAATLFAVKHTVRKKTVIVSLAVVITAFHFLEKTPQIPLIPKLFFLLFLALPAFALHEKIRFKRAVLSASIISAFAAVFLLNFHNIDFENNLYKLAALKIAKPNVFYYEHLTESETEKILNNLNREKINLFNNSLAYRYWNYSRFPFETFSSSLEITNGEDTVYFYYNGKRASKRSSGKFSVLVSKRDENFAVISSVNFSPRKIFNSNLPEFFIADNQAAVSLARSLKLSLMIFKDSVLVFSSLPATITKSKKNTLLEKISENKQKIFNEKISGKNYEFFAVGNKKENEIYLFIKKSKSVAVGLYESIKILALFLLFILLPLVFEVIPRAIKGKIKFSFRDAIFAGLVFVSIVPLVLLAFYFRNLSEEKNLSSTYFKLNKKALAVGKYLKSKENESFEAYDLFEQAGADLRFDFSVFHKDKIYFTTHPLYFENGLLPDVLNPQTIVNIELEQLNDILLEEKIERYKRNVFYSKVAFGGENYVIQIDEAFNPILLPMSEKALDVMLVTSYSVAALGIILFGLILAYYLSKPIAELTTATREIAKGNLDLKLKTKAFGEVKELIDGFNYMSEELKRTQKKLLESERESAWREMARQVAHEIKNPLTPMKLSVQQLVAMKREKSENFDSAFDKITASVLAQIDLLKNIASEFSSLGKMPKVKLADIELREMLKKIKSLYSNKRIEIIVHNSLTNIKVKSDEEYLTRIFVNLIQNAEDAGADKIEISAETKRNKIFVYVKNNGIPIPEIARNRIFEKNYTTKKKGSGLGLYISFRFMRETGGDIVLEKSDEKETVFKLTFEERHE